MAITSFTGKYRFLSNFWLTPVEFCGIEYPSSEHAYQAHKSLDPQISLKVLQLKTPGEAKRFGRKIVLRPDWESYKLVLMEQLLRRKFEPGSELATRLLNTGDEELVEGNHWNDTFWGVCRGRGENHLGKLLMKIRSELRTRA